MNLTVIMIATAMATTTTPAMQSDGAAQPKKVYTKPADRISCRIIAPNGGIQRRVCATQREWRDQQLQQQQAIRQQQTCMNQGVPNC